MKTLIASGLFFLTCQFGLSQQLSAKTNTTAVVESSPMLGLRTTIYHVSDMQKATEWYSAVFNAKPTFNEPYYVGFNIAGYELGLQPEENPLGEKVKSVIAYWGVSDINKEYNRILKLGATEVEKPFNIGGELMIASLKDPWGNIIGIIYNPEFKLSK